MMNKFKVSFEVNIINPGSDTLSVSRKRGTSTFNSELDEDEIVARKDELAMSISMDLTSQGMMVFDTPTIKSVKPWKKRKATGATIKRLKQMFKK